MSLPDSNPDTNKKVYLEVQLMKRITAISLGTIATLVTLSSHVPALANWHQAIKTIAQNHQAKAAIKLSLQGEKRIVRKNAQGQDVIEWQETQNVKPGDIFRYSVNSQNQTQKPIKNLTVVQPIPPGMIYVLKSATVSQGSQLTYSIDRGKTFVSEPKVPVIVNGKTEMQPAPADAYTHVRWTIPTIGAGSVITVSYQVRVR